MAKKVKTVFVCQECGYESAKWQGQCICGAWNSFVEEKVVAAAESTDKRRRAGMAAGGTSDNKRSRPSKLTEVKSGAYTRMDTGIAELNRVLGGGMVKGSLTLISGEPGIGKSTLLLQLANFSAGSKKVLYISGEESDKQIKIRAERLGALCENLYILNETDLDAICLCIEKIKPACIVP